MWSSPISASTPPYFDVPARLTCFKASPALSTPGPFPYQIPKTPSNFPLPRKLDCWVPHNDVAANSSFIPG